MSLTAIKNQPVVFDETIGINPMGSFNYAQLVSATDRTHIQLKNERCNIFGELVTGGDFSNPVADWTYGSGWAFQSATSSSAQKIAGSSSDLSQSDVFNIGKYYRLDIEVEAIEIVDGSVGFTITDGAQVLGYITGAGTNTFYFFAESTSIVITPGNDSDTGTFTGVTAYQLTNNVIVSVWKTDGTYLDSIDTDNDPNQFQFIKDRVNIVLDWSNVSGITTGDCCYVCIHDECINTNGQNGITNGDFLYTDSTGAPKLWTQSNISNAEISVTKVYPNTYMAIRSTGIATIDIQHDLIAVGEFNYKITVNILDDDGGNWSCTVECGDASQLQTLSGTSVSYSLTNASAVDTDIKLKFQTGSAGILKIASVTMTLVNKSNLSCDMQTNDFSYKTTHADTILLNANNHQDACGFVFDGGSIFNPNMRVNGRLAPPDDPYNIQRNTELDSIGNVDVTFYQRRKSMVLALQNEPLYVYDFITLMLGLRHAFINNTEYTFDDDEFPKITWNRSRTLGKAELKVSEKTQDIEQITTTTDNVGGRAMNDNLRATTSGEIRITTDDVERQITNH